MERHSAAGVTTRWPVLQLPTDWTTLFEPDAGCLFVEACVQAQLAAAAAAGAEFQHGTVVREISCHGTGIKLTTDTDRSGHAACLYTMTPDSHALADLSWTGSTRLPIGCLSPARFQNR